MNSALKGHLAALTANVVWGLMAPIAKIVMVGGLIGPLVLTNLRVFGAAILFWLFSLLQPREKVPAKDLLRFFFASLFAITLNQGSFIFGVGLTAPGEASILTTSMPLWAMLLSAILLKDPVTIKKVIGIAAGAGGALLLILSSQSTASADPNIHSSILGDALVVCAQLSFAFYIVRFRDLVARYSLFTTMKWMFTFSAMCLLPVSFDSLVATEWTALSQSEILSIAYIVACATFLSFLLIVIGQKNLPPTVAAMYNYVQPVISCCVSIAIGLDTFGWVKGVAVVLIFSGVYLVTHSTPKKDQDAYHKKQLEVLAKREAQKAKAQNTK